VNIFHLIVLTFKSYQIDHGELFQKDTVLENGNKDGHERGRNRRFVVDYKVPGRLFIFS
jgi:hypothetical protein